MNNRRNMSFLRDKERKYQNTFGDDSEDYSFQARNDGYNIYNRKSKSKNMNKNVKGVKQKPKMTLKKKIFNAYENSGYLKHDFYEIMSDAKIIAIQAKLLEQIYSLIDQ